MANRTTHEIPPNFSISFFPAKNNMRKCDYASSRHNGKSISSFSFLHSSLNLPFLRLVVVKKKSFVAALCV